MVAQRLGLEARVGDTPVLRTAASRPHRPSKPATMDCVVFISDDARFRENCRVTDERLKSACEIRPRISAMTSEVS